MIAVLNLRQFPEREIEPGVPTAFRVVAGRVNPFREQTAVLLEMPNPRPVQIYVFDLSGRTVRSLYSGTLPPGRHELPWDGTSDTGQRLGSGVYVLQVAETKVANVHRLAESQGYPLRAGMEKE